MKIRTTRYIIKEGLLNSYRNKLMSLASMSIVVASLIIFGMFLLITVNLNYSLKSLKEQPEIQAFCYPELDDTQVDVVENAIKGNLKIDEYRKVTKAEAFEKIKKEVLEGKEGLLEDLDESIMPVSFRIKLKDLGESDQVVNELKGLTGVENVTYAREAIEIISRIAYWIPLISGILLIVMVTISMFIIANTIKLTVFARRREINIMKYIGATDWFIRWPFVIEGVIIGLLGSIIAFVLVGYGYGMFESKINEDLAKIGFDFIKIVGLSQVALNIFLLFTLLGSVIGALGSLISIRKYLRV